LQISNLKRDFPSLHRLPSERSTYIIKAENRFFGNGRQAKRKQEKKELRRPPPTYADKGSLKAYWGQKVPEKGIICRGALTREKKTVSETIQALCPFLKDSV
jgi:hypothetical protein